MYVRALGLVFATLRRESTMYIKDREEDKEKLSKDVEILATMKKKVLEKNSKPEWEYLEAHERHMEVPEIVEFWEQKTTKESGPQSLLELTPLRFRLNGD